MNNQNENQIKVQRKRRKTDRPTRDDLERAAPELFMCPHCWRWGVVKGYVCNYCYQDCHGKAVAQDGRMIYD